MYGPHRHFTHDIGTQIFSLHFLLQSILSEQQLGRLIFLAPKLNKQVKQTKKPVPSSLIPLFLSLKRSVCKQTFLVPLSEYTQMSALLPTATTTIQVFCWNHWNGFLVHGLPASTLEPLQPHILLLPCSRTLKPMHLEPVEHWLSTRHWSKPFAC